MSSVDQPREFKKKKFSWLVGGIRGGGRPTLRMACARGTLVLTSFFSRLVNFLGICFSSLLLLVVLELENSLSGECILCFFWKKQNFRPTINLDTSVLFNLRLLVPVRLQPHPKTNIKKINGAAFSCGRMAVSPAGPRIGLPHVA